MCEKAVLVSLSDFFCQMGNVKSGAQASYSSYTAVW